MRLFFYSDLLYEHGLLVEDEPVKSIVRVNPF